MRQLRYIISDVRDTTDNKDTNGVADKEFCRYARDFVRSVQAIVYKNNPRCAYFQNSYSISSPVAGTTYDLPSDVYAENAVTFVEYRSEASLNDTYSPLDMCWPEDQNNFFGWFTRNSSLTFTGGRLVAIGYAARAWYFQRVAMWDKQWATVNGAPAGQVVTLAVTDADFSNVDNFCCFIIPATGLQRVAGIKFSLTSPTTITCVGDISSVQSGDILVMGKNSTLDVDFPEECETYAMDYIAKRVTARNNYAESLKSMEFSDEAKGDLIAIFADAAQAQLRTPITDTAFLRL